MNSDRCKRADVSDKGFTRRHLIHAISTGTLAIGAGCSGGTSDSSTDTARDETEAVDASSREVSVVLSGAPEGLQKYECTINHDGEGVIERIEPQLITGEQFQIVEGGSGSSSATVRAADLAQQIDSFDEDRVLFSVIFDQSVSDIFVSLGEITNDNGEDMDEDRILLNYNSSS